MLVWTKTLGEGPVTLGNPDVSDRINRSSCVYGDGIASSGACG